MEEPIRQPQKETNSMALASMILGIISVAIILVSFCIFPLAAGGIGFFMGVIALILSLIAKKQIREQDGLPSQNKMATAGLILGIVGSILGIIGLAVSILGLLLATGPGIQNIFENIVNNLNN